MTGLLLLSRWQMCDMSPAFQSRTSPCQLSPMEVTMTYGGFDGKLWPNRRLLEDSGIEIPEGADLIDLSRFETIAKLYEDNYSKIEDKLIFMTSDLDFPEPAISDSNVALEFLGFDYGIYNGEYICYSVLFNEILFGKYEPLRKFAVQLNNFLMFPDLGLLKEMQIERRTLVENGADLEYEDSSNPFHPIKIWA